MVTTLASQMTELKRNSDTTTLQIKALLDAQQLLFKKVYSMQTQLDIVQDQLQEQQAWIDHSLQSIVPPSDLEDSHESCHSKLHEKREHKATFPALQQQPKDAQPQVSAEHSPSPNTLSPTPPSADNSPSPNNSSSPNHLSPTAPPAGNYTKCGILNARISGMGGGVCTVSLRHGSLRLGIGCFGEDGFNLLKKVIN